MVPRSRGNTTKSGNALDAGEKSQENLDEYDMSDIIVTIYALGEAQKEIFTTVKELKNSILKPSEKASVKDCTPREKCS
ncbi:S ribonuclease [Pyrus ussuriensis x Pyrus communis]|uniref:S ribonuclease n=1 Tax=Pyrus ussuriensis x Pyrus communis TaxID=2448454 RepID=A0A5N5G9W3_9ROSA|nr:S ribonuclease [Pyrus ussuriensis x Pyrus communis]